jgi:ribulose-phosphate 3-epimerase
MKENKQVLVAPSILSANFSALGEAVKKIQKAQGDWVHFDVMDGMFVPNITFGHKILADVRSLVSLPMDVHLMVEHPENQVNNFAEAGADHIIFHTEAVVHAHRLVQRIKDLGKKAGVSIVPSTPVSTLSELLPFLDIILIMSVNPGFGGQELIPSCLQKIEELDRLRRQHDYSYVISVDGGINRHTSHLAREAGVDVIIAGSAFFSTDDPAEEVRILRGTKKVI